MRRLIILYSFGIISGCGCDRSPSEVKDIDVDDTATSISPDSNLEDTEIQTVPDQTPELLYETGDSHLLEVDETHLYFDQVGSIVRAPKEGTGEIQFLGGASGYFNQNMAMDEEFIYVLWGSSVIKFNKITEERTSFSLEEYYTDQEDMVVIAVDNSRIYSASVACKKIVSISKDGTDPWMAEMSRTGEDNGTMTMALDDDNIYCSGGAGGSTMGRIYRYPKTGIGEFEEVTAAPDIDSLWDRGCGSKVGGISIVNDTVYYINNYDGNCWIEKLVSAPRSGGASTLLAQFDMSRETLDICSNTEKNALYFIPLRQSGIVKYNWASHTLSKLTISGLPPFSVIAADDKYIYYQVDNETVEGIYSVKIF